MFSLILHRRTKNEIIFSWRTFHFNFLCKYHSQYIPIKWDYILVQHVGYGGPNIISNNKIPTKIQRYFVTKTYSRVEETMSSIDKKVNLSFLVSV